MIGPDGEQVGVIETAQAQRMADDAGMDLVEISPDARPPVCKIMDFGKFKYEQSKKDSKNRSSSKASEMKEVRLGRSVKIDIHDVQIRVNQSRNFLLDGHKVLITQRFKGREMAHREIGINRLNEIAKQLADIAKLESSPRWMGPSASIILAPDKAKCEAYKRAHGLNKPKLEAKAKELRDKEKEDARAKKYEAEEAARLAAGGAPSAKAQEPVEGEHASAE